MVRDAIESLKDGARRTGVGRAREEVLAEVE
jgi:hypothetical protein